MDIQPIAGALGAEIHGVDFSEELSNSEASAVSVSYTHLTLPTNA